MLDCEALLWYIYFGRNKTPQQEEPRMNILHDILEKLKNEFALSRKGDERGGWFVYTLVAIIIPFTSSKTSNILRCLNTLFGLPAYAKNDSTRSWLRPRSPGSGYGKPCGR